MRNSPILIVDDDPLFRDAVQTALTLNGYRVVLAADGREALRALETELPAIMLLDLHMPHLDGEAVLRELQARRLQLPVLLLTAADEGEAVARRFGLAAYLPKPIAVPGLLDAIGACGTSPRPRRKRRQAA
jgi:DNA-binding response OmpR family regulator